MDHSELIQIINKDLETELPLITRSEMLREKLAAFLNQLIQSDFQKLIFLLYRIDIDEIKLKKFLHENPQKDAGLIIADMVIERELQKIKSRQAFRRDSNTEENEKW